MNNDLTQEFAYFVAKLTLEKTLRGVRMTTGLEITGTIRSIQAAIGLAKSITEIAKKLDNAELIRLIADLNLEMAGANLKLADVSNQLAKVKQENLQLQEKIRQLENESKTEKSLTLKDDGFYYDGDDGPFCTGCFDTQKQTIRLQKTTSHSSAFGRYKCPSCRDFFG